MEPVARIDAVGNARVKIWRSLQRAAGRRAHGRFLVEGRRAIQGLVDHGCVPEVVMLADAIDPAPDWPAAEVLRLGRRVVEVLSSTRTAAGYFAVCRQPLPGDPDPQQAALVCVGVADPGNVGTLIRSAAAFACPQVVLVGGADPYSAKAVAASAGAVAAVALCFQPEESGPQALGLAPLLALVPRGGLAPADLPAGRPWHLLVGNEAHGLPSSWIAACEHRLTLPMAGATESLNAAVAGSIGLYALSVAVRGR